MSASDDINLVPGKTIAMRPRESQFIPFRSCGVDGPPIMNSTYGYLASRFVMQHSIQDTVDAFGKLMLEDTKRFMDQETSSLVHMRFLFETAREIDSKDNMLHTQSQIESYLFTETLKTTQLPIDNVYKLELSKLVIMFVAGQGFETPTNKGKVRAGMIEFDIFCFEKSKIMNEIYDDFCRSKGIIE